MCGIAGIMSLDGSAVRLEDLHSMCGAMIHRGPDDEGFCIGTGIGLGMRRLSIIDLETGHQPVGNEDGTIWVVLNGEIYNFRELRRDLEQQGHAFSTRTDTEVIVHLYEEYGPRCVDYLRGMFALALWDSRRRQLLLARDRLGIKPLYYTQAGGRLIFASELKAILQLPAVDRGLNWAAVGHLFTWLTTPPSESIIAGVHKLEPGHILVVAPGQEPRLQQYWDVRFEPDYSRTDEYFVERLREALDEAVRLHLVSDVPVGAFLSGGLDSTAVVAMMSRLTSAPVKTFSIGFREEDYNELTYARLAAREFGTEHRELILEPDVIRILDDLPWYLDEPFGDPSAIPTYMVAQLAAEHVTVVLSGDGGDELFAGYDKYAVEAQEGRRQRFLPAPARRLLGVIARLAPDGMKGRAFLRHLSLAGVERYLDATTLFHRDEKEKLFTPDVAGYFANHDPWRVAAEHLESATGGWLSALQYLDFKAYLPLDILTKVDRTSMAHSLEARVPLLDHRLVELVATIPPELKLRGGRTKDIFKRAMQGIVPDRIINRPKHGFAVPLGRWFRGQLGRVVRELLLSEKSRRRGIFNSDYIEQLVRRHEHGRDLDLHLWTLMSFELWCQTFIDGGARSIPARLAATPSPVVVASGK